VIDDYRPGSRLPADDHQRNRPISITYQKEHISLLQLIRELSVLAGVQYTIYGDRYLVFGPATDQQPVESATDQE